MTKHGLKSLSSLGVLLQTDLQWRPSCKSVRLVWSGRAYDFARISMFQGAVFLSVVIYIPQKLQIVNGNTPLEAGYRLLALTLASSVGAAVAVFLRETRHIASFYLFLVAGVLQIVPLALLGSISPLSRDLQPGFYGFEVLMGLGLGMSLALPINLVPLVFESRDAGEY